MKGGCWGASVCDATDEKDRKRKVERGKVVNCGRVCIAEGGLKGGFRPDIRHGSTRAPGHAFLS